MIFITGVSFQGKLDFAMAHFGLSDSDIFLCDEDTAALDASGKCVAYVERWALNRLRAGFDPLEEIEKHLSKLEDTVVIATDISGGVVPMDAQMRAWREACGRMSALLAARSGEVWRLFCGLPQRLK